MLLQLRNYSKVVEKLCRVTSTNMSMLYFPVETCLRMAGRKISLQDLIHRLHLSQDLLEKELSEEHLREVSRIIADHEIVGPELGLTLQEMTTISSNNVNKQEVQKMEMLRKWKQKCIWNATYGKLIEAFLNCGRADHACDVCELLTKSELRM